MERMRSEDIRKKYGMGIWILVNDGQDLAIYFPVEGGKYENRLDGYASWHFVSESIIKASQMLFTVLDYQDDSQSIKPITGECKCPIITLLQEGCTCGSISRYCAPSLS